MPPWVRRSDGRRLPPNAEIAVRAHMEPVLLKGGMAPATASPVNMRLQKFCA